MCVKTVNKLKQHLLDDW